MMAVVGAARRDVLEEPVQIGDGARFELDRRDRRGRADDEDRRDAGAAVRLGDGGGDKVRDVVRVALPFRGDVAPVGGDHRRW